MTEDGTTWENGGLLQIGSVDVRRRVIAQPVLFDITDDAYDNARAIFVNRVGIVTEEQLAADGIFLGQKTVNKGFVDDNGPGSTSRVVRVEVAAALERNF